MEVSSWMDRMTGVRTDGRWAVLIEACRPHHKTRHHDLRRTIEAILWRCQGEAAQPTGRVRSPAQVC